MQNQVRTDSERDANRGDSQNHVQKTQHSEKDIFRLSGTKRPVALKHEESEDPTLIPRPSDEVSNMLQTHVLGNIS